MKRNSKNRYWAEPRPIRTIYVENLQVMESFEVVETIDHARLRVLSRKLKREQRRNRRKGKAK